LEFKISLITEVYIDFFKVSDLGSQEQYNRFLPEAEVAGKR
jgi:hypothetical protein